MAEKTPAACSMLKAHMVRKKERQDNAVGAEQLQQREKAWVGRRGSMTVSATTIDCVEQQRGAREIERERGIPSY